MSDPSVDQTPRDAGTTPADEAGQEGSPRSGALREPDVESPGAAGRAEPGVPAPPDTNQPGVEPVPPQGDRVDAVPESTGGGRGRGAASTSGAADRLPTGDDGASAPAGSGSPQHLAGTAPADDRPEVDAGSSTSGDGAASETPASGGAGRSSRTPGDLGEPPQPFEPDLEAGAARMAPGAPPASTAPPGDVPGDAHGVSVNDTHAMAGTSEQFSAVHGIRTAVSDDGSPQAGSSRGAGAPGRTAAAEGAGAVAPSAGPVPGATAGSASASAGVGASSGLPDPAAQPQALVDTDEAGPGERTATLTSGEGRHTTKDGGPADGRGAITGRRSSPDGEVGSA